MTRAETAAESPSAALPFWTWALAATVVVTLARMLAMRLSPLELYPDEAQYWLWSRTIEPGYFTKPPLVAWIIHLSTAGGDAEPYVRLSSPLLHAATGLLLYGVGRRLYDGAAGLFAMLVYQLMPAVQVGAFVVSTDTPLVAFLAAALLAYVGLQTAEGRAKLAAGAALGLSLGLAFLAKYAALYAVAGIALHLVVSKDARRAWRPGAAGLALIVFALMISANIVWNVQNGYAAVGKIASEASWGARSGGPLPALVFLAGQLAVFGPAPFLILAGGGALLAWRRRLAPPDLLLLAWTLPPLSVVLVQSFIAGANANWAVAAYAPASVLVAAWMLRWGRPRWLLAILAGHLLVLLVMLVGEDMPQLADRVGLSSAVRGLRGGREIAQTIVTRARTEIVTGDSLTAVAVDERELFNLTAYYGRDFFGSEGPPLLAWKPGPKPRNEGELVSPLTAAAGAHVLMVSRDGVNVAAMQRQCQHAGAPALGEVWTDPRHKIDFQMFVCDGFAPK